MNPKWNWPAAALVFACCGGCPGVVPTSPHGEGVIAPQTIKAIKTGESREDVLLSLGDPAVRLLDDRYFVYDWKQTVGYWFVVVPAPGGYGGSVAGAPIKSRHYLAIEFDSDDRVRRLSEFSHWGSEGSDVELNKWMDGAAESHGENKP
jgi:outer membrane protein assembly factor BamE (lipoprotein component of BamABCDE complex)